MMKKEEAIKVLEGCKYGDIINDEILKSIVFMINLSNGLNSYNQSVERVGESFINKFGDVAKIIEYIDSNHLTIEFQDEKRANIATSYKNLKNRDFKNPYGKRIFGVGCIGNAKSRNKNGDKKKSYTTWFAMIQRCYKECFEKKTTYKDCLVCDEWLCYENFEKWFDENYYEIPGEIVDLDKDILSKENKIYSPNTCIFVPQQINKYFVKRASSKDGYPLGVYKNKSGSYGARAIHTNKRIGTFKTIEEASNAYKQIKTESLHKTTNEYKQYLPQFIYDILMDYEF